MSPMVSITCPPGPVRLRPIKREPKSYERKRHHHHHNGGSDVVVGRAVGSRSSMGSGDEMDDSPLPTSEPPPPPPKRHRSSAVAAASETEGGSRDSTDLFCATIAGMLRELQPLHRERIKRDIYNVVSDALLSELTN